MAIAEPRPDPTLSGSVGVDELASTLLRYVSACPNACDTVDGICDWWIPRQRYLDARANVVAALALLESRGQLEARTGIDGRVLYRAPGHRAA